MKILFMVVLAIALVSCGDVEDEIISQTEPETVGVEQNSIGAELQNQLEDVHIDEESMQHELNVPKESVGEMEKEPESKVEEISEIKVDEGFAIATDPITVPGSSTQSEFVVELTAENFMSVLEFKGVSRYDTWGEYRGKIWGFSSLLYEQGWALGKVEDFAVEYSLFDDERTSTSDLIGSKSMEFGRFAEDANPNLRIYRAKGTLTFYPIEDVSDEVESSAEYDVRVIRRTLPDGSLIRIYTDLEGTMVY